MQYYLTTEGFIIDQDSNIVIMDDREISYQSYLTFIEDGGSLLNYEGLSQPDIDKRINDIKQRYSRMITLIPGMREHIERNVIDGTPVPQEILNERARLKAECNREIDEIS